LLIWSHIAIVISMKESYDVIVIGGGASGMMAAGKAAESGARVLLLEKNKTLGKKLKITGGGRCNITNAEFSSHDLLEFYGNAKDFLHSPFSQFGVKETIDLFESKKLSIIVQDRKRAFPSTHKALDVFSVLLDYMKKGSVEIKTSTTVIETKLKDGGISSVVTDDGEYVAKNYILATGGLSRPETGSTGDGFKWLTDLGHSVIEPLPNVVPLSVKEKWVKNVAGVVLPDMKVTFKVNDKKAFSERGSLLFTHTGVSGPLILNSSAKVSDLLHEGEVMAIIDAFPDMNHAELEKHILDIFEENKNKILKNVFSDIAHSTVAKIIREKFGNSILQTKNHSVTKEQRKEILHYLKAIPLTITGLMGYEKAVISDGGVSLDEIDTRTMKSKKVSNLYITGDLLNIRRPSGGYSLQLCWTTGFVAGLHSAE
jgi:predicted Rossmann fold flavoprotein